jgi:hypothetical protein
LIYVSDLLHPAATTTTNTKHEASSNFILKRSQNHHFITYTATMMKTRTAGSALAAAATLTSLSLLFVLISGSHAAAATMISSEEVDSNHHLRRRPVGVTPIDLELADDVNPDPDPAPSSFVGSVLRNLLNTNEDKHYEDLDSHYPLFLTNNERSEDDYDINDVLLSFTIRKPKSDIMRQPPRRKLAEVAHEDVTTTHADADTTHAADATHAEDTTHEGDEGDHGDAEDYVVHVTYENIYAILVFLIAATALGIVTSKLGMVSAIFFIPYMLSEILFDTVLIDATSI